jgi:methylthioribose-1-phosphate isomerase
VTHIGGQLLAPVGVQAAHPAFDVTPHTLIDAIITEHGIIKAPFEQHLQRIMEQRLTSSAGRLTTDHSPAASA